MLLANMAKDDRIERLLTLQRNVQSYLSASSLAMDQLMDVFVRGADGSFNRYANFDYLAYLFADLAKFSSGARYFLTPQSYDNVHPFSKLMPFFSHASTVRRQGASAATKNAAFAQLDAHALLLAPPLDILPYILRPLASGADEYKPEEEEELPEELQFLDRSVERESDLLILRTHLDTLLLLTSSREGRDQLRAKGVYYVVRECHLAVEDDEVREGCDRVVQVLMRDEEGEEKPISQEVQAAAHGAPGKMMTQEKEESESEDEDEKVVEIAL